MQIPKCNSELKMQVIMTPSNQKSFQGKLAPIPYGNPNVSRLLPSPCIFQYPKVNPFPKVPNCTIKNKKKKGFYMNPCRIGAVKCVAPIAPQVQYNMSKVNMVKTNSKKKHMIMNTQMMAGVCGNVGLNSIFNSQPDNLNKKSRIPFSPEEDAKIKELAEKHGTRQWGLIASFLVGRTPKQCRDRYANYLVPGYFKGQWSNEEDELLEKLYRQHGPKWSVLQKSFPGRSANSIKNRWNYFLCRLIKDEKKTNDENAEMENKSNLDESLNYLNEEESFSDQNDDICNNSLIEFIDPISDILKGGNDNAFNFIEQENEMLEILSGDMISFENEWSSFN